MVLYKMIIMIAHQFVYTGMLILPGPKNIGQNSVNHYSCVHGFYVPLTAKAM